MYAEPADLSVQATRSSEHPVMNLSKKTYVVNRGVSAPPARRVHQRGSTMVVVISAVAVVGVMMLTMLTATVEGSKWTDQQVESFQVEAAAETAVAMVASQVWSGYEREAQRYPGLLGFQNYLEAQGITNQPAGENWSTTTDYREKMGAHVGHDGKHIVDGIEISELIVRREDDFETTRLFIEVEARDPAALADASRASFRVQHVYEIAAGEWEGTEFALLSNNVNCLLCHTNVDNAERFYNDHSGNFGTFDRVRLGSLETFHVREDPESTIAGSVYLGGDAVLEDGSPITDWNALSFEAAQFNSEGKLIEDSWGQLIHGSLNPANAITPQPGENLYLDYLAGGEEGQVDGMLPSSFPSPFPDNGGIDMASGETTPEYGGNRKVDKNEFEAATAGVNGSISGGTISVMGKRWADRVNNNSKLNKMLAGNAESVSGSQDANVYLHGTEADPIILSGDVAIDGDLVISGYVKGSGSLKVSGNVYMPSDVKYADGVNGNGNRTFGVAPDGTKNTLAIASGGNVVMGDYYRPAWGSGKDTNGWGSGSFNFIMEEMAAFNRMEWMKTQATLPGKKVKVQVGENVWIEKKPIKEKEYYYVTRDTYKWVKTGKKIRKTKYKWVKKNNGRPAPYYKEWNEKVFDSYYWVDEKKKVKTGTKQVRKSRWVETGRFREIEHRDPIYEWQAPQYENPNYAGANYTPRYYSFKKNSYIPIPNKKGHFDPDTNLWMADEIQGGWSSSKMNYARENKTWDPFIYENGQKKAAVYTVTPTNDWIDQSRMTKLIRDQIGDRDGSEDVHIDATIYSNNSIFGIVADDEANGTNGRLLVNGLIVAADVGLLAPNGTQINYDPRGRSMMDIQSDSTLTIRRHLRTPLPTQ